MAKYQTKTRTVYQTERVRIDRVNDRFGAWFQVYFDSEYAGNFASQAAAETEAGVWLHEQAERLSVYQRAA